MRDLSPLDKKIPWSDDAPLERVAIIRPNTKAAPYELPHQNDALHDYYEMGSGRSLAKLHAAYTCTGDVDPTVIAMWESRGPEPPTVKLQALERWSRDKDWQVRVARQSDLDAAIDEAKRKQRRAEAIAYIEDKGIEHGRLIIDAVERLLETAGPGETVSIVTRDEHGHPKVEQVELLSVEAYLDLMKLRLEGDVLMRRAVRLPDKYTQTRLADHEGGALEMPRIVYEEAAPPGDANEANDAEDGE